MKAYLTALAPLLGLLFPVIAWPQNPADTETDSAQRWYRVELLVFSQGGSAAASQERWDPEPALAYPERYRFLVYPERVQQRIASHPGGDSSIDPQGRQVITFKPPQEAQPEPAYEAQATDIPRRGDSEAAAPPVTEPETEEEQKPQLPQPWLVRPASELEFRGKAAYMEKQGSYRVLFHQSWLQPVAEEKQARAIVIDDSGSEGRYPVLQGSVKLYVARYLHLSTHLWLNTDGSYLPGDWRMPAPPLAPASLVIEKPVDLAAIGAYEKSEPAGEALAAEPADDLATNQDSDAGSRAAPVYPYRHAVLLEQRRRMRSSEVHYIDHPMMGAVVKLTPLSPEQLEQYSAEEQQAAQQLVGAGETSGHQGL
ncbi:CsiV family protein [Parahaliea aestuarii]|uniref:CsiV family protein n=1 Tax=Parahaliea aestuarii TaxID=1852021 RepID=UPI0016501351|nr:CsiV family protein [Parahaliea aestuarii]